MALPSVNETVLDGQLATANFIAGQTPIIIGCSSTGTAATVKAYAGNQPAAIIADWGYGPMPQQAARLSSKGIAVAVCRTASTTAGAQTAVTFTGTGTSVVTTTGNSFDTYRVQFLVVTGGTIGVAGISFQISLDGGETFGAITRLGTANTYAIPNTGITLNFGAGTLVAADLAKFSATEPKWAAGTDLLNALTAASNSAIPWDFPHIVGSMNATESATLVTWLTGLETAKRFTRAIVETVRMASSALWSSANDATWQAVLISDWATQTSKRIMVCAGDVRWVSAVDGSVYLRPVGWLACEMASLFDNARYELGRVKDDGHNTGALDASLYDPLGNAVGHNEVFFPGLYEPAISSIGFTVARTYPQKGKAVYLSKAKLFSPATSDFTTFRLGRVMDIACSALNVFFVTEIQETPPVNPNGTILTTYAEALELQALSILNQQLLAPGRAAGATVSIHRNENLLSGTYKGIVNVDVRIQPTPTTDFVNLTLSFSATLPTQA